MTDTSEALRPEEILPELQALDTVRLLGEALEDQTDGDRRCRARDLQATSRAVIDSEGTQRDLAARIAHLERVMGILQARGATLWGEIQAARQERASAVLRLYSADMPDKLDISGLLQPGTEELERSVIIDAITEAGGQLVVLRDELRVAQIGHDLCLGKDYEALAGFLGGETLRMASGAVIFEGEIQLDPAKGRSGDARRKASHHLRQYAQNKADYQRERRL